MVPFKVENNLIQVDKESTIISLYKYDDQKSLPKCTACQWVLSQMCYSSTRSYLVPLLLAKNRGLQFAQAHQNWLVKSLEECWSYSNLQPGCIIAWMCASTNGSNKVDNFRCKILQYIMIFNKSCLWPRERLASLIFVLFHGRL